MSRRRVAIEALSLKLGAFALRDFGCVLEPGEILVVLGPNGAGKSVALEAIAGFHRLHRGRIEIAGRDVTRLPPERRGVSLLFQNFGLFPHLTVAQNAAFGGRTDAANRRRQSHGLLDRFGIAALADRYPQHLSPGQKQRVALARAFAASPDLFLFDEPFSAIDAPTRESLREELQAFLRADDIPSIFVTHDRTDATALADKIAVLDHGTVLQSGNAAAVLARPVSARVARLVGVENIFPARWIAAGNDDPRVAVAGIPMTTRGAASTESAIMVGIRAEDVGLLPADGAAKPREGADAFTRLPARVEALTSLGPVFRVALDCGFPLVAYLSKREAHALDLVPGRPVIAEIDAAAVTPLAADDPAPAAAPGLAASRKHRRLFDALAAKVADPSL